MAKMPRPLSGPPPQEVWLPRAPLVRVIAQVRFPTILAINKPDKVSEFQDMIRDTYPILVMDRVPHLVMATSGGMPNVQEGLIWRFSDREQDPEWRVSLGVDFVALEATRYASRRDFLDRLRGIVAGLDAAFKPKKVQRFGLRYINRLKGDALERIAELIQPKVLGIVQPTNDAPVRLGEAVAQILTQAELVAEEGHLQARWGSIPKNGSYDPNALEPINEPSWVLDLDMFTVGAVDFASDNLMMTATRFAERNYCVFREMVTEEFLRHYGGAA